MAGVTTNPAGSGPDGSRGAGDVPGMPGGTVAPIDPRAVRVRVAATSGGPGDAMIRVAPPAEPLTMTNPTVGRGPLGGMAAVAPPDDEGQDAVGVFAYGHPVVDGDARPVTFEDRGRGRAMLVEADRLSAVRTRVVLEPPVRVEGGVLRREVAIDGFRFDVEIVPERIAALRARRIGGAGLDVYEHEPDVPEALRVLDNVPLLPHLGTSTAEVRTAMGMMALDNARAHRDGRDLPNAL